MENFHNGNIEIISFVGKLRYKPALTIFLGVGKGMKQT
jgi:hypothetical protein